VAHADLFDTVEDLQTVERDRRQAFAPPDVLCGWYNERLGLFSNRYLGPDSELVDLRLTPSPEPTPTDEPDAAGRSAR
jgi:hypothetical protein